MLLNSEQSISLWQARTVVYLADSSLTSTFLETQPGRASMCNDITSDRLLGIWVEHRAGSSIDLCYHLVGNDHCNTKLVCQTLEGPHESGHV